MNDDLSFSGLSSDDEEIATRHSNAYKCDCGCSFSHASSLNRHVRLKHPDKTSQKHFKFPCSECHRRFNRLACYKAHRRKEHKLDIVTGALLICPLCKNSFPKKEIQQHFFLLHDLKIETESHQFSSFQDFESWKEKLEAETNCKFVKKNGDYKKTKTHSNCQNFVCFRSGHFVSESTGVRQLKTQGSRKINGYCPARIRATVYSDGKCEIVFVKTHVGHQNTLKHMLLTSTEREQLAIKIAAKVPLKEILSEVRDSSTSQIRRLHMITKKDLHNIKASFNLNGNVTREKVHKYINNKNAKKIEELKDTNDDILVIDNSESNNENAIVSNLTRDKCISDNELQEWKKNMFAMFSEAINSVSNKNQMLYIDNLLKSIETTLNAMHSTNLTISATNEFEFIPSNATVETQKPLLITNKRRKLGIGILKLCSE